MDIIKEAKRSNIDTGYFSVPQEISWKTANNETAHGYYYPPQVRINCQMDYDKPQPLALLEFKNILKTTVFAC